MRKKFHHCLLFLILFNCSLAYDFFRHVEPKPFGKNALADSDAPVIEEISVTSCVLHVTWTCSETCHENLNRYNVYWQQTGSDESSSVYVNQHNLLYDIENLNADQSYTVWVASVKDDGEHNSDQKEASTNPGEPQKVTVVHAETQSDSMITVSWDPTSNPCPIKGYSINWTGMALWDESLKPMGDHIVSEDTTSYEAAYLTPYTRYDFYVSEIATDGIVGEPSDPSTDITDEGSAGPPEDVTSQSLSSSSVKVSWSPPYEKNGVITGYSVTWQLLSDTEEVGDATTGEDVLSYEAKGLRACGEYSFSVKAINGAENGEEGTTVSTTNPDEEPPIFQDFSYDNLTSKSVVLTWQHMDTLCPVTYYLNSEGVVLWGGTIDPFDIMFTIEDNFYLLEDLIPWSWYNLTMHARTTGGGTSDPISQPITTDEDAAGPPKVFNISTIDSYSVFLNWSVPDEQNGDISGYKISCKNGLSFSDDCKGSTGSDVLSYLAEGLDACGHYHFTVQAVNGAGDGEEEKSTSITEPESPKPITNVRVVYKAAKSINITFEPPDTTCPVTSYNIHGVGETLWSGETLLYSKTLGGEEMDYYVLDGLIPYSSYTFSITATTDGGPTNATEFFANTAEDGPSEPMNFEAVPLTPKTVLLTWDEPQYLNGETLKYYTLSYALLGEGNQDIRINRRDTSYTLGRKLREVLLPCRTYKIILKAVNDFGPGDPAPRRATLEPDVPSKLKDLTCSVKGSNAIDLNWEVRRSSCKIQNYELSLNGNIIWGGKTSSSENITTTGKSYSLTSLIPNTKYTINLRPFTTAGAATLPTKCVCETELDYPGSPRNLEVNDKSQTEIEIKFKAPENRNGVLKPFTIEYNGDHVTVEASTDTSKTYSITLKDLDDDVIYTINVFAENGKGLSEAATIPAETDKNHLGVILGTVIPLVVIIIAVIGGVWYNKQSKKKKKKITQDH